MPNWCGNTVTVLGPGDQVRALIKNVDDSAGPDRTSFSLNKIVPEPEDADPDWCIRGWGTKWNPDADAPTVVDLPDTRVWASWTFESAWSPPGPAVAALASQYPDIEITLLYQEMGMGLAGFAQWHADPAPNGNPKNPDVSVNLAAVHPVGCPYGLVDVDLRHPLITAAGQAGDPVILVDLMTANVHYDVGDSGALVYGDPATVTAWLDTLPPRQFAAVPAADGVTWVHPTTALLLDAVADDSKRDLRVSWWAEHAGDTWDHLPRVDRFRDALVDEASRFDERPLPQRQALLEFAVSLVTDTYPQHDQTGPLAARFAARPDAALLLRLLMALHEPIAHAQLEPAMTAALRDAG